MYNLHWTPFHVKVYMVIIDHKLKICCFAPWPIVCRISSVKLATRVFAFGTDMLGSRLTSWAYAIERIKGTLYFLF